MKIVTGPAAQGDYYFDRPELTDLFFKRIEQSHNLSIVAPRRVGKSSFMLHLATLDIPGYECKYLITESVNDSNEFFRKLYKTLIMCLHTGKKFKQFFEDLFKRLDIRKVSLTEIEFGRNEIDYYNEILLLCREVKETDRKIILLVDEFSQTIENIITDQGVSAAKNFLHKCRELRQTPEVNKRLGFVYAGSIGLENLVASINEPRTIIDLGSLKMPALNRKEALTLIEMVLDGDDIEFAPAARNYLLDRLNWLLPYFIQLLMLEAEILLKEKGSKKITKAIIDEAFDRSLGNRSYFEQWFTRLRGIFKGAEFNCAKDILNKAAKNDGIDKADLNDTGAKHSVEEVRNLLNVMLHDGYLDWNEPAGKYCFNSPLLRGWWLQNIVV